MPSSIDRQIKTNTDRFTNAQASAQEQFKTLEQAFEELGYVGK